MRKAALASSALRIGERRMIARRFIVLLAAIGLGTAAFAEAESDDERPKDTYYRVEPTLTTNTKIVAFAAANIDDLEAELDSTGEMLLPLHDGTATLELREVDILGPDARVIQGDDGFGGTQIVGLVTARTFQGKAGGAERSWAAITIDSANDLLLGMFILDGRVFDVFTSSSPDGSVMVATSWNTGLDGSRFLPAERGPLGTTGAYATRSEYMGALADYDYKLFEGAGWTTRVASQVNAQWGLWDSVSIHMHIAYFRETGSDWGGDCGNNVDNLNNYLASNGIAASAHIHQLFSGNELNGLGCSHGGRPFRDRDNVAAIEALDHWPGDGYNPTTSTTEYAVVSGHEAGHQNYNGGDPFHPVESTCTAWWFSWCLNWQYNVMCCPESGYGNVQPDDQGLWWPQNYWSNIQSNAYNRL